MWDILSNMTLWTPDWRIKVNRTELTSVILSNLTINSLYPKLWAVDSFTFTFNASQTTYALPDDLEQILFVSWQTTGSSKEWLPVNRWRADGMANIATFNSTNTINIYENIQPGRTVQVYYTTTPDTLENNSDDFADVFIGSAFFAAFFNCALSDEPLSGFNCFFSVPFDRNLWLTC